MTSAAMCCGNRGDRGVLGRSHSHLVRAGASSQRSNDDPVGARGDQRRRAAEQAAASRDRRPREFRRAGVPFLGVGPRRRPARQAGSHGRRGRQRLPDRARHCGRRRPLDRVPADRAVDVSEPELSRRGRPRRAVGASASAVLRPVVPVPAVLAGLRQRP